MELAKEIALLRTRRGWTQEELAEHSGLSVRTIRNVELGHVQNPRRSSVDLLAHALGLSEQPPHPEDGGANPARWRGPQLPSAPLVGPLSIREQLAQTVRTNRLTTFHGPGGVGKTRLASGVAADVCVTFEHGVAFVELGDIPAERRCGEYQTSTIMRRVERQLGWEQSAGPGSGAADQPWSTAADGGREADLLLVLDNAEHIPAGTTEATRALLSRFPRMHILITARRQLSERFGANREIRPLTVDPVTGGTLSSAAELVLRHVGADSPVAADLARNLPQLTELCRRLGGMPRYLEFAAERMRTIPIQMLLMNGPAMDMLRTKDHALLQHQRSVAESIGWDLELLSDGHRKLLEKISAFPLPGFRLNDLVAGYERLRNYAAVTPLTLLSDLLETSLVVADPDEPYQYRLAPFVGEVASAWPSPEVDGQDGWLIARGA